MARQRFAGEWMIDQPSHALYEASRYYFHEEGALEHLGSCSFGGPAPTGVVTDPAKEVQCDFAGRWSAPDSATLVIDSTCSDERDREIVLVFPTDTSGNATGLPASAIEIAEVGGEVGWIHEVEWRWRKCEEQSCEPEIAECPSI